MIRFLHRHYLSMIPWLWGLLLQGCQHADTPVGMKEEASLQQKYDTARDLIGSDSVVSLLIPNMLVPSTVSYSEDCFPNRPPAILQGSLSTVQSPLGVVPYTKALSPQRIVSSNAAQQPHQVISDSVFTTSSGERVRFKQDRGRWQAELSSVLGIHKILPVVSAVDIGELLTWLQHQDIWAAKARIHLVLTPQLPRTMCVYLGRYGLLGGSGTEQKIPTRDASTGEEASDVTTQQGATHPQNSEQITEIETMLEESKQKISMLEARYSRLPHPDLADAYNDVGLAYTRLGKAHQALEFYEKAEKNRKALYERHSSYDTAADLADIYSNIGLAYTGLGNPQQALVHYSEALRIYQELHEEIENADTASDLADTLNNQGVAYHTLGALENGLRCYEQALTLRRDVYEYAPHPDIASSLNNIGEVYQQLGERDKGLEYQVQALEMRREIYGDAPHPDVASSLSNVGKAYLAEGKKDEGFAYQEEALAIYQTLYGDKPHPSTARSLASIGELYAGRGQAEKGLAYCEEALAICRSLYGEELPPDTAQVLRALGVTLVELGRHAEALGHKQKALAMHEHLLGKDKEDYDLTRAWSDVASSLSQLGQRREALDCQQIVLAMRKRLWPNQDHPEIAHTLNSLGELSNHIGEHEKAIQYKKDALAMRQRLFPGRDHPDTARSLVSVGIGYAKLDDLGEALPYKQQALEMRRRLFANPDDPHPSLAHSLNNVGDTLVQLGASEKNTARMQEGLAALEEALAMRKKIYGAGTPHQYTADSLTSMGIALTKLGNPEKGLERAHEALAMLEKVYPDRDHDYKERALRAIREGRAELDKSAESGDSEMRLRDQAQAMPEKPDAPPPSAPLPVPAPGKPLATPSAPLTATKTPSDRSLGGDSTATGLTHPTVSTAQSTLSKSDRVVGKKPVSDPAKDKASYQAPFAPFGAQAWKEYFGVDVGEEPALPENIEAILNSTAPFTLDGETTPQRIRDNHLLVLIPAKVNGEAYSLTKLGEFVKRYFPGNKEGYSYYADDVRKQFGGASPGKPYWMLLTRSVLSGSRNRSYTDQKKIVQKYSRQGYGLPSGLEAATGILLHYARHRERLFGDSPWTYTRCTDTELVDRQWPIALGGFGASGLDVSYHSLYGTSHFGVAGCWKL